MALIDVRKMLATWPIHGADVTPEEVLRKVRVVRTTSTDKDIRYLAQVALNAASEQSNLLQAVELLRNHHPAAFAAL